MSINLNNCAQECHTCVKSYIKKHNLKKGQSFDISCRGIPKEYVPEEILVQLSLPEAKAAVSVLDPVIWAAETLDWHCLDPDGSVWKRKNPDEYWSWVEANPGKDVYGHSRYHRPYQAEMLRCTSKRKVFRIGRQAGKTETLVISMLYHLFTKPGVPEDQGFKIVVITPYQSQIDLIFGRMMQLIRSSPLTNNSIKRNVKAPIYSIELHNESKVSGFTAGTKSGGNAESVRGQTANMLVFDEADYLSSGDIDAAMSIITNYPNATVWMSSTPSGKREKFYDMCHSKRYKEYHFPSNVNPMWTEELNETFLEQLTEIGYKHEILAEFGEQEQGVFQNSYVQNAKAEYKYGDFAYHHTWTYTVGVDWNDTKNGTTINVLGFDPARNTFFIVDRHVVSREGWTQLSACNKIAEVNRLWKPTAIYVDAGFGATQLEVLRKYGFDALSDPTRGPTHPDSALSRNVKPYNFSSKVETRDLFTKQPLQKAAKPFLVESTVRRFEAGDIKFPENDEALEAQLLGYIVDRITPTGNPVYKADNEAAGDHALDALMLSIVAFVLEITPIGKPRFHHKMAFSGRIGEMTDAMERLASPGDLVFTDNNKERILKEKARHKPTGTRAETMRQESLFKQNQLPANHVSHNVKAKPWRNDGFSHDGPAPKVRTVDEAMNDARRRLGIAPRRGGKPRRKNI